MYVMCKVHGAVCSHTIRCLIKDYEASISLAICRSVWAYQACASQYNVARRSSRTNSTVRSSECQNVCRIVAGFSQNLRYVNLHVSFLTGSLRMNRLPDSEVAL